MEKQSVKDPKMFTKEEVALRENVSIPVPVRLQKMIYETLTTQMS